MSMPSILDLSQLITRPGFLVLTETPRTLLWPSSLCRVMPHNKIRADPSPTDWNRRQRDSDEVFAYHNNILDCDETQIPNREQRWFSGVASSRANAFIFRRQISFPRGGPESPLYQHSSIASCPTNMRRCT